MIAGGSGIGSSERNKVVKFQVGRIIAPVVWRFDDLGWLMNAPVRQEIPRSLPDAVGPFQDPEEDDFGEPALIPKPVQELLSPPKTWLEKHGFTLDCGACKSIQKTGAYHSKKHTIPCRKRYTQSVAEQRPQGDEPPKPSVPGGESTKPSVSEHPSGGRRVRAKRPHVAVEEGDEPMGLEPGGEPSGEAEVEVPEAEGDEAMGVPEGEIGGVAGGWEAMEVDNLEPTVDEIELLLLEMRERAQEMSWYRGLEERVVNGRIWFRVEAFGSSFWESIPERPVCEVSGQAMEPKALKDAVVLELAEMTRLKVGRLVSEGDGRERSSMVKRSPVELASSAIDTERRLAVVMGCQLESKAEEVALLQDARALYSQLLRSGRVRRRQERRLDAGCKKPEARRKTSEAAWHRRRRAHVRKASRARHSMSHPSSWLESCSA